jgi:hypothetical protein
MIGLGTGLLFACAKRQSCRQALLYSGLKIGPRRTNRTPEREKSLFTRGSLTPTLLRVAARALVRPRLLLILLATAWKFRRRGWYRQPPFLPLPPAEYMRWRQHTAYGEEARTTSAEELEAYVRWAARMRQNQSMGDDA